MPPDRNPLAFSSRTKGEQYSQWSLGRRFPATLPLIFPFLFTKSLYPSSTNRSPPALRMVVFADFLHGGDKQFAILSKFEFGTNR